MRITVVGPGAVGLLLAARLSQAGAQVGILDYRPQRAQDLDREGFILEDEAGEHRLRVPAGAEPAALAQCDLALVCVKAYQTEQVARTLAQHLPAPARALTLQNGTGNVEALARALGDERVLGGITSEGATRLAPDRVRHAGRGQTHLGPAAGPVDDFSRQVAALLERAGFQTQAVAGAQNLIWTKLLVNVGINALTAILGQPNGMLLELAGARSVMEGAVAEAQAVGQALGIEFLHQDMQEAVREVARRTGKNISSMLQDVRARRRTEVEFINGAVAAKGQELGIPTPINATLTQLVRALEQQYL